MRRSCVTQGQRKQLSASGAADARPRHQKPSFATLAVVVADFRNEIGTNRTSRDVRSSVAIGGEADMARKAVSVAIDQVQSEPQKF